MLTRLLTFRAIKERPLRLLLSMTGIMLGVAGILAISVTNRTALDAISRLFTDTSGKANLVVLPQSTEGGSIPAYIIDRVETAPGVELAIPSLQVTTLLANDDTPPDLSLSFFGTNIGGLRLYGIDPEVDQFAREYKLAAGRFLSPALDGKEIVLVDSYAAENEFALNDTVEIVTAFGPDTFLLVGLITKDGPGQVNNGAFGVIPIETAQKLFDRPDEIDQIDILVNPEQTSTQEIEAAKTLLQNRLGELYSVIFPAAQGQRMVQMLSSYQIGLNFLSGVSLFVGAFLIYNAFSMTIIERTREIGMLRTIGMTRRQVTSQVLSEAVFLGMVGSAMGVLLGFILARGLTALMEALLSQDLRTVEIPLSAIIPSSLIGIFVTLLAAFIPAWQAGRITPLEALRIRGQRKPGWLLERGAWLGAGLLALSAGVLIWNPFPYDVQFRFGSLVVFSLFFGGTLIIPGTVGAWERISRYTIARLYGSSGRLGSANIQRSTLRTTLTVGALMIGVSMMIIVWVMTESFKGDLVDWLDGYIGGDLYISSSVNIQRDLWGKLEAVEGISAVTPIRYLDVTWRLPDQTEEKLSLMAVDPTTYTRVTHFVFSQDHTQFEPQAALQSLAEGGSLLISSVISEKYGLMPGDSMTLLTRTGPQAFTVAGIVVDFYNQGLVVEGNWQDVQRHFRVYQPTAFMAKIEPGYDPVMIEARIDSLYGRQEHLIIESNRDMKDSVSQLLNQAFSMFDILALISMSVAFLGITNTLTMNVMERTQEIGMLRSIGMTRWQIVLMIAAEAALMGVIGGLLGLAFGYILSRIFMASMTAMSGYRLTFIVPTAQVLSGVLIAVIVSQAAAILPAWRAVRIAIMEAIHYE